MYRREKTYLRQSGGSRIIRLTDNDSISQRIENIMNGKDYQQGSIEKDGNRQRRSETIQDEEITISKMSYKT